MSTNRPNDAYQLDQGNPDGCYFTWTRGDATGGLIAADAITGKLKLVTTDSEQGVTGIRGMTGVQGNSVTGGTGIAGMTGIRGLVGDYGGTGIAGMTGVQAAVAGYTGDIFGATGIYSCTNGLVTSVL
jgi:hypothetical protein